MNFSKIFGNKFNAFFDLFCDWDPYYAYCNDMVTFWPTQGGKHKVLKTYRTQTMRDEHDCCQGTVVKKIVPAKDSSCKG